MYSNGDPSGSLLGAAGLGVLATTGTDLVVVPIVVIAVVAIVSGLLLIRTRILGRRELER